MRIRRRSRTVVVDRDADRAFRPGVPSLGPFDRHDTIPGDELVEAEIVCLARLESIEIDVVATRAVRNIAGST